jgi:hypothetical protein
MKTLTLVVSIIALAVNVVGAQESKPEADKARKVKQVHVTSRTLSQRAGRAYIVDVSRVGTVYNVNAGIDYRHVRVRTPEGETPMSDVATKMAVTGRSFMIGQLDDLISLLPPGGGTGTSEAQCTGAICNCTGRKDCSDLSKSGKCLPGPGAATCGKGSGGKWGCSCTRAP